jgi:cyclophilin family peptidyl-prolyl cis-trans isomerase
MLHYQKTPANCLALLALTVLTACNRGGETTKTPPAAIAGQNDNATASDGLSTASKKPASDPQHPVVQIETSLGNITVKLDGEKAPLTVDNFLSYVASSHYDQTIVHQVYKGQGFLAGGYGTNLVEKPGRTPVRNEAHNGLKNRRGTIAMVRMPDAIDSATCQFFVNVAENPALDFKDRTIEGYGYCVFGEVTAGLDTIDAIGNASVHDTAEFESTPTQPILIKAIRRLE